jgi:uncharacterized membrane protein YqjE
VAFGSTNGSSWRDQLRTVRDEAEAWRTDAADIAGEVQRLVQMQMELAQAEATEARNRATMGAAFGSVALVFAILTDLFLLLTLMFALDTALPLWASALITAGVAVLLMGLFALLARQQLKKFSPVPRRFIRSLEEDAQWARSQIRSRMR